ncbi:hypothetical protein [Hungatella sp.]|uniref:hypothetical protein n=1 Tax=Hungatella sp. TaxID=2613924 RepID=UPI002A83C2DC|nr:hypothetical protein [Hungatella sp.]
MNQIAHILNEVQIQTVLFISNQGKAVKWRVIQNAESQLFIELRMDPVKIQCIDKERAYAAGCQLVGRIQVTYV